MSLLRTLRLLDDNNQVSLTNIAVYVVLVKLAMSPAQPVDAVMLLLALLNYTYKKVLNKDAAGLSEAVDEKMAAMEKKIEEAKAIASKAELKAALFKGGN